MPPQQRIAVVGAGLAGLAAAWWLSRQHRVTLFERQPRPGFTASSVEVPDAAGRAVRVDVPLRVFYPGYYPTLTRLYQALGVASEPVSYASSFTDTAGRLLFRYRNLRLGDLRTSWVAPQDLLRPHARQVLAGLLRFHRESLPALVQGQLAGRSVGDWLRTQRYPQAFVDTLLLPAICTVCTCSREQALSYPAPVIVGYLGSGLTRQPVRRARGGADEVEQRLTQGIGELRCGTRLAAVQRLGDGVRLQHDDGTQEDFDQVVLATQANQARRLLADASADEAAMLEGFRYQPVEVLSHRDPALMPPRRAHWSPVNLRLDETQPAPESTIWLNAVQPALHGAAPVFQTVHPQREPAPAQLIGRARFERPLVDGSSQRALAGLHALHAQAGRRVWFCGSYAQAGIPLLESAVHSAWQVALKLGVDQSAPATKSA